MPDSTTLDSYYEMLGVDRNATLDDIEAAYYRLAKEKDGHPDKPGGKKDSFIDLTEAYKTLKAIHGRSEDGSQPNHSDQRPRSTQARQEPTQQTGNARAPRRQRDREPRSRGEQQPPPSQRAQQDQRGRQRPEPAPGPSAREAPTQPPRSPSRTRQSQPRSPSGGPRPPTAQERRRQEARERREREAQERREQEARERREQEERDREEEERARITRVKRRLRVAALLLASGAMAVGVACDFLSIDIPTVPLSFTIFPAIAMLGGILFVATLPSSDNMDVRFLIPGAMIGYILATGHLDEIYTINPSRAEFRADVPTEVRALLAFPAFFVDAQVDAYSHRYGSIPAICVGVIIAGFWRLGLEGRTKGEIRSRRPLANEGKPEKSGDLPPVAELGNTALGVFGNSLLTAPFSYAVLHTALLLAFLIIVGIPFAIVDIFADISMTQIFEGDLWHLWIVIVTSFAALMCGRSIGRIPRLIDHFLRRITRGGNRARDRLVGTTFLMLALMPSAAMFALIALVGLYWEPVLLPLIQWAY